MPGGRIDAIEYGLSSISMAQTDRGRHTFSTTLALGRLKRERGKMMNDVCAAHRRLSPLRLQIAAAVPCPPRRQIARNRRLKYVVESTRARGYL